MNARQRQEALDEIAVLLMRAGCEFAVALRADGQGVVAIADGTRRLEVATALRKVADNIESDRIDLVGRSAVDVEEDSP